MRLPIPLAAFALSFALCAAPGSMAGTAKTQGSSIQLVNPAACPVGLAAEQRGLNSETIPVGPSGWSAPAPNTKGASQSFDLSMTNSRLQRIVGAELEVHGTSNKSRMVPAGSVVLTNQPKADTVRNVHLVSSVPADETRTHSVSVKDLTSVSWITVVELRYADGSTWHAHPGSECRVVPDGMMLIANK